jgi:hypothetical protein
LFAFLHRNQRSGDAQRLSVGFGFDQDCSIRAQRQAGAKLFLTGSTAHRNGNHFFRYALLLSGARLLRCRFRRTGLRTFSRC